MFLLRLQNSYKQIFSLTFIKCCIKGHSVGAKHPWAAGKLQAADPCSGVGQTISLKGNFPLATKEARGLQQWESFS